MKNVLHLGIQIILVNGKLGSCAKRTVAVFNEENQNSNLKHNYVLELVAKFNGTGPLANKKIRIGVFANETVQMDVLSPFPATPTRNVTRNSDNIITIQLMSP